MIFSIFQDGTPTTKTFEHIASEIGAEEAEEVGVEHLLRYSDKLICYAAKRHMQFEINYLKHF